MRVPALGATLYALVAVMAALALAGPFLPISVSTVFVSLLLYVALAYSINFITGLTGYVSFGHVVFLGVGAYSLGYAVSAWGVHPLVGIALGALVGFLLAFGMGAVTLRFRGVYFAIASLVTAVAAFDVVQVIPGLHDGQGIILNLGFEPLARYYTLWFLIAAEIAVTYVVTRGRFGLAIRAIRGDEDAAKALGVNVAWVKQVLFSVSGVFAGAAGGVYTWTISNVMPTDVFALSFSLLMLAMIVVGGMGTLLGPFLGAAVVYLPSYYLLTVASGVQLILIGALVVIIALVVPTGIVGFLRRYAPTVGRHLE